MIVCNDEKSTYKSASPIDEAIGREAKREMYKQQTWFTEAAEAVADRERFRPDLEAAAACAPGYIGNLLRSADWALAGIAVLNALAGYAGEDENGIRRAVPAGVWYVADLLAALGFYEGLALSSQKSYASALLEYLRAAKRIRLVREAKRVSRDKGDGDAREWLVYLGGREWSADEPHTATICWLKRHERQKAEKTQVKSEPEALTTEQPHEPQSPRVEPKATSADKFADKLKELASEMVEADAVRPPKPATERDDGHTPTRAAVEFKAVDAAECAQAKFGNARPRAKPRNGAASKVAPTASTAKVTLTPSASTSEQRTERAPAEAAEANDAIDEADWLNSPVESQYEQPAVATAPSGRCALVGYERPKYDRRTKPKKGIANRWRLRSWAEMLHAMCRPKRRAPDEPEPI